MNLFNKSESFTIIQSKLEKYVTHKNVLTTLAMVLDVQEAFKGLSEEFQIKGSSILGKAKSQGQSNGT